MLVCSALAPDGSLVDGFEFDGTTVTYRGSEEVDAGIRISLELPPTDDPAWLIPGVFYGENRPAAGTKLFPRFTHDVDLGRMESPAWSFRADRCATPAVFARGGGLVTREASPLGQSGVVFASRDGRPTIWLDFPYREEPIRYDGSDTPDLPDVRTYRWRPGEQVALAVEQRSGDWRTELRPPGTLVKEAWVSVEEAAELAAYGLHRWHYKPDPARLIETRSFDGLEERDHMHVSWVSGAPYAYALLRHGRRTGTTSTSQLQRPCSTTSPRISRRRASTGRSGRATGAGRGAGIPTTRARTRARSVTRRSSCSAPAAGGRSPHAPTSPSHCARSATTARSRMRSISTRVSPSPGTVT